MKNKIRNFIDAIFSFILFYIVFYALFIRYSTHTIASLCAIDIAFILQNVYLSRSEKSRKRAMLKENLKNFFIFTPVNLTEFFAHALSVRYKTDKTNGKLTIGDAYVHFALSLSPLSYANVADAFKNRTKDKIVIMCFSCDKKALKLAQSLPVDIKIMEEDEVFKLLAFVKALPTKHVEISRKYPLRNFLQDIAHAKISKRLLFSAFVIALFSLITPFRNYYIFFSVFLILIAIIPSFIRLAIKKQG
ncbi:MAG: hypothetical protein E7353_05475 [Clostridiales bacterium]|nr:hypothetical protein [Clostridiales bacterium]